MCEVHSYLCVTTSYKMSTFFTMLMRQGLKTKKNQKDSWHVKKFNDWKNAWLAYRHRQLKFITKRVSGKKCKRVKVYLVVSKPVAHGSQQLAQSLFIYHTFRKHKHKSVAFMVPFPRQFWGTDTRHEFQTSLEWQHYWNRECPETHSSTHIDTNILLRYRHKFCLKC